MKQIIGFSLGDHGYHRIGAASDEMILMSMFLTTDYFVYFSGFLTKWLNDSTQDSTNANITYLQKKNGMVVIGDLYEKEPIVVFQLPIDRFTKLLGDWEKVVRQKPKKIIITKDGDKITIESKN